jgi:hypothetical protein
MRDEKISESELVMTMSSEILETSPVCIGGQDDGTIMRCLDVGPGIHPWLAYLVTFLVIRQMGSSLIARGGLFSFCHLFHDLPVKLASIRQDGLHRQMGSSLFPRRPSLRMLALGHVRRRSSKPKGLLGEARFEH